MTSTDRVELKSTIDSELPWKMVVKGSRSSTRRSKKSVVRVAASDIKAEDKSSTGTLVAEESEPGKLGVSVPGRHFAERVEQVPIKKRRFMVPCPTLSNRSSAQREGSEQQTQINPVSRLNPNLIDGRTSDAHNEKLDIGGHDFSGIKILADVACSSVADVACNSDMSVDLAPAIELLPAEEPLVQEQDVSTLSTCVEGNDSSAGTAADVSQKWTSGQGKNDNSAPQEFPADERCVTANRVTSGGMIVAKKISIALSNESSTERPKSHMEASETENLAPDSVAVTVSGKSLAKEPTEKKNDGLKDVKFLWDLNVPMDAWDQPCDVEDEASVRNVEGEITKSIAPKESRTVDESKEDGVIASDGHANYTSPSGPKANEAASRNGKECQSGYDSQFEDGELREPYAWEETDAGEVEQLDYGSEPEDERFYSVVESNDNKLEVSEKEIMAETKLGAVKCESGDALRIGEANEGSDIEKHVVDYVRESHPTKRSSSPSRSFGSKPFKQLPYDGTHRRRSDNYRELSTGPDKFVGRDDRSGMRMRNRSPGRGYYSGWDSRDNRSDMRRFSPPNYKGGSYGFGRPQHKSMVDDRDMMNGFDQSGPGPGPNGYVRRQFSNGGYRGRFRRFPDGGDRDFRGPHGDNNPYPGRMNNRMSGNRRERGNSPVFRRLNYQQSESRSRSRSPVSWNGRNRSPPPPGGFRADERMMERVRLPFQKRFPAEQEIGFLSPPKNRMSSPRFFEGRNNDTGENYNNFRESKFRPGQRFDVGNSMRRPNPDNNNNNNNQFRPFIRHRRFDSAEENAGGNRFEMPQRRTRWSEARTEATEDGGDNVGRSRLNGEQSVEVANNNNNKEES